MSASLLARVPVPVKLAAPLAVALLAAAACSSGSSSSSGSTSTSSSASPSAAAPASSAASSTVITTKTSSGGSYLTNSAGRAIYLFMADSTGKSTCDGACASAWPPVIASGQPTAIRAFRLPLAPPLAGSDSDPEIRRSFAPSK